MELQLDRDDVRLLRDVLRRDDRVVGGRQKELLERLETYSHVVPSNKLHSGLVELSNKLYELAAIYRLRVCTDPGEKPEGVKHLAPPSEAGVVALLLEAFGSYVSCVSEEQCWSAETFGGLMHGIERTLRSLGEPPEGEGEWLFIDQAEAELLRDMGKRIVDRG